MWAAGSLRSPIGRYRLGEAEVLDGSNPVWAASYSDQALKLVSRNRRYLLRLASAGDSIGKTQQAAVIRATVESGYLTRQGVVSMLYAAEDIALASGKDIGDIQSLSDKFGAIQGSMSATTTPAPSAAPSWPKPSGDVFDLETFKGLEKGAGKDAGGVEKAKRPTKLFGDGGWVGDGGMIDPTTILGMLQLFGLLLAAGVAFYVVDKAVSD